MLALDQNIWFGIAGLLLGVLFALSMCLGAAQATAHGNRAC